jgi:hypothetical protein
MGLLFYDLYITQIYSYFRLEGSEKYSKSVYLRPSASILLSAQGSHAGIGSSSDSAG